MDSATGLPGCARNPALRDTATSVYRYYDRHDILIYVGITSRGWTRNREHNSAADWWQYVARQEVDHHETRAQAEACERTLIRTHLPPFNTKHNPDAKDLRATYLGWLHAGSADQDPFELWREIGRSLPLVPLSIGAEKQYGLRTLPHHFAIASRIQPVSAADRVQVQAGHCVGRISAVERCGSTTLILVEGRRMVPIVEAAAVLRCISQKPVQFRVSSIQARVVRPDRDAELETAG